MATRTPRRPLGAAVIGVLLIVVGGQFLARNAGWFDVDWADVWPILIILIGLWIVVSAIRGRRGTGGRTFSAPRGVEERLDLELGVGAGTFRLTGGAEPGQLVTVDSTDDDIDARVRRDGPLVGIRLRREASWWPFGWWRGGTEWSVRVSPDVPTRVDVAGGAGQFEFDLGDIRVAEARVAVGAAQVRLRLPRPIGDVPVHVSTGASALTIEVPPGVQARVATGGLLAVDGPTETPGYAGAANRVSVRVDGGVGSVAIRAGP